MYGGVFTNSYGPQYILLHSAFYVFIIIHDERIILKSHHTI